MRVLLIEDDHNHAYLIERRLRQGGMDVVSLESAEGGLQAVLSGERFDAVLCDIHLPGGMDGIVFAEKAQRLRVFDGVLMIAISSHAMQSAKDRAIGAGFAEFIAKPFSPDLARDVKSLIEARKAREV